MTSVVSGPRGGTDALTTQAIVHRESIAKNYVPIVHPEIYLPMLHLRKDGDCEIGDPRACLHHYTSAADLACIVYAEISRFYFDAMVRAGYIAHGLRVVLHCSEYDEYDERTVVKKHDGGGPSEENVEDMLLKYRTKQGTCRPGVELISLETGYRFQEQRSPARGRLSSAANSGGRLPVRSTVKSGEAWRKKVLEEKKLHDCQRRLHTEETARTMAGGAACRGSGSQPESRASVPTLIIKAAWCFPGHEARRKRYGYHPM